MKSVAVPRLVGASAILIVAQAVATGQAGPASIPSGGDPGNLARFSRAIRARYDTIKREIVEAAEAVPDSEYSFKPASQTRSFGAIIGHLADSQSFFCGVAAGTNPDYSDAIEKANDAKPFVLSALRASFAACDDVYEGTSAENVMTTVKAGSGEALRGLMLLDNVGHDAEHYGNIVTYMRLKGHQPPPTVGGEAASD